jgi:hypothetical protein
MLTLSVFSRAPIDASPETSATTAALNCLTCATINSAQDILGTVATADVPEAGRTSRMHDKGVADD